MSDLREATARRIQIELRRLSVTRPDPRALSAVMAPMSCFEVWEAIRLQVEPGVHSQWFHQPWVIFVYGPFGFADPALATRRERDERCANLLSAIDEASKLLLKPISGEGIDSTYRWLRELFAVAMKKLPNTALSAEKLAWIGYVNKRRTLENAMRFDPDSLIYSMKDQSPAWYSFIEDVPSASISLIDILLSGGEPTTSLRSAVVLPTRIPHSEIPLLIRQWRRLWTLIIRADGPKKIVNNANGNPMLIRYDEACEVAIKKVGSLLATAIHERGLKSDAVSDAAANPLKMIVDEKDRKKEADFQIELLAINVNIQPASAPPHPETRSGQTEKSAEQIQDGPLPPKSFRWQGKQLDNIEPKPLKLLSYLWNDRRAKVADAERNVWGDESESDARLKSAVGRANKALTDAGCPLQIHKSSDWLTLE
jgi:hypothetical protein